MLCSRRYDFLFFVKCILFCCNETRVVAVSIKAGIQILIALPIVENMSMAMIFVVHYIFLIPHWKFYVWCFPSLPVVSPSKNSVKFAIHEACFDVSVDYLEMNDITVANRVQHCTIVLEINRVLCSMYLTDFTCTGLSKSEQ